MTNDFESSQKIEAYLRNELSPSEKLAFEEHVNQDPLLQNELTLQKDIITALQNYRKAELKQRLNKIDVSDAPDSPSYLRLMSFTLALTATLAIGTLLYFTNSSKVKTLPVAADTKQKSISQEKQTPVISQEYSASIDTHKSISTPTSSVEDVTETATFGSEQPSSNVNQVISKPTGSKTIRTEKENESLQREYKSSETGRSSSTKQQLEEERIYNDTENESGKIKQVSSNSSNGLNITFDTSKYKFHYKSYQDQLELYGDFTKGYKKVKLKDQVYIYFEDNFYPIKSNQSKITPLVKVTDEAEIQELYKVLNQE